MLRHRINTKPFFLSALGRVVKGEIPEPPTNLQLEPMKKGAALHITWDAPTTGANPFLYEVFLDGVFLVRTANLSYTIGDIAYGVLYAFKVRSVAILGERSAFTPEETHIGGGQPDIILHAYPYYRAIQLKWKEVDSNVDYEIEGYHVYEVIGSTYIQLNVGLLPLDVTSWDIYNLSSEQHRFAVAYEYNVGLLSPYYEVTEVPRAAPGKSYWVSGYGRASGQVISPEGKGGGVQVDEGTKFTLTSFRTSGPTARQWANVASTDWGIYIAGKKPEIFRQLYGYPPNCPVTEVIQRGEDIATWTPIQKTISISLRRTNSHFIVSGPPCSSSGFKEISGLFILNIGNTNTLYIKPSGNLEIFTMDDPKEVTATVVGYDIFVSWLDYPNNEYNVFMREPSGQYVKMNNTPIVVDNFVILGVSPGVYYIAVGFIHESGYETKPIEVKDPLRVEVI